MIRKSYVITLERRKQDRKNTGKALGQMNMAMKKYSTGE
jgi:hypothetical protein